MALVDQHNEGLLEHATLLHFIPSIQKIGGLERVTEQIQHALLQKNEGLTIVQVSYTAQHRMRLSETHVGKGVYCRIYLPAPAVRQRTLDVLYWCFAACILPYNWLRLETLLPSAMVYRSISGTLQRWNHTVRPKASASQRTLEDILNKYAPDAVILHSVHHRECLEIAVQAADRGIPLLLINHLEHRYFHTPVAKKLVRMTKHVASVSPPDASVPASIRAHVHYRSSGIDTDFFSPQNSGTDGTQLIVLLPARINMLKGHVDMLRIAAEARKRGAPAFEIRCVGAEDHRGLTQALKHLAKFYGVCDHICFTGSVSPERMRDEYARATVVLLPTYSEGVSNVLLEAQAMEVPVITYDTGGTPCALKDTTTGFLIRKGDIRTCAEKLVALLTQQEVRRRMGRNGRDFVVAHHSLSALVSRQEVWYARAIYRPVPRYNAERKHANGHRTPLLSANR